MKLRIHALPAFDDNYIWMIADPNSDHAIVVDPGDAEVVLDWLAQNHRTLSGILITHKHHDHIGGVQKLVAHTSAQVYRPYDLYLTDEDICVADSDQFSFFGIDWQVLAIPGHTLEHIMFYCPEQSVAFVGDTLFAGGCGRVFEGTPKQMYQSLSKIMALPDETNIYAAHEYTINNLHFALAHDPDNQQLQQRMVTVKRMREQNEPTLPTTVGVERATNPFCRPQQLRARAEIQHGDKLSQDWQVFAFLRQAKDVA